MGRPGDVFRGPHTHLRVEKRMKTDREDSRPDRYGLCQTLPFAHVELAGLAIAGGPTRFSSVKRACESTKQNDPYSDISAGTLQGRVSPSCQRPRGCSPSALRRRRVHLGQDAFQHSPCKKAPGDRCDHRRIRKHRGEEAPRSHGRADYIGFGPPSSQTASKAECRPGKRTRGAPQVVKPDPLPIVAIGGINHRERPSCDGGQERTALQ